ncbi:MAG: AzlC family ABC transporter permease [Spirochaeta sp.]
MGRSNHISLRDIAGGMTHALPIAAGYFPVAVAFGLSAGTTGLTILEGTAMSVIVFAGASQFLALGLISAGALPLQIIFSGVLLNLRHLLFSANIAERTPGWRRRHHLLNAFGLTDEVFALASSQPELHPGRLLGMEIIAYSSWVGGTAAGFAAGELLPADLHMALGTALYALFAALLAVHLRRSCRNLLPAAAAAGVHLLLRKFTPVDPGWSFTLAILIGAGIAAGIHSYIPKNTEDVTDDLS